MGSRLLAFARRRIIILTVLVLSTAVAGFAKTRPEPVYDAGSAEPHKSPRQIVADARAALRRVHSYHVEGTEYEGTNPVLIRGDYAGPHRIDFWVLRDAAATETRITDSGIFMKANRYYWLSPRAPRLSERAIAALSDRWIKPTPTTQRAVRRWADLISPANLAHCMTLRLGTLRSVGVSPTGLPTVELSDAGDVPGGAPGEIHVALVGPPLPVRLIQTGAPRPGGGFDPICDVDGAPKTTSSDLYYSYGHPVTIDTPRNALDFSGQPPIGRPV